MGINTATSLPAQGLAAPTKQLEPTILHLSDQMGADVVTITVGSAFGWDVVATQFKVHKKILGWRETGSQSANLPDDDPKALKLLVGWVYGGKIEVPADAEGPIDILLGLSAMANKFALSSLADEAIEYLNAMMLARNWLPSASQMAKAYRLTPSGSKLRLLMSHICVFVTVTYGDDYSKSA